MSVKKSTGSQLCHKDDDGIRNCVNNPIELGGWFYTLTSSWGVFCLPFHCHNVATLAN